MVDIYRSRRNNFYKVAYYKRNEKGIRDNDVLTYNKEPSGYFYARFISDKRINDNHTVGVFAHHSDEVNIITSDSVDISSHDKIVLKGKEWIVVYVQETFINKNSEFSNNESKETILTIRRGR